MLLSVWLSTFLAKSFLEPQPSEERQFLTATKHRAGVRTQAAGRESRRWVAPRKTAARQLRRRSGLGKPANQINGSERVKCTNFQERLVWEARRLAGFSKSPAPFAMRMTHGQEEEDTF